MRIMMWSGSYSPSVGGVEFVVQQLARGLSAQGHSVTVVTQSWGEESVVDRESEGAVHRFPFHQTLASRDPNRVLVLSGQVRRLFEEVEPDVVHAHAMHPSEFFLLKALSQVQTPLVFTMHGWSTMPDGEHSLRSRVLEAATVIAGCSADVVKKLIHAYPLLVDRTVTIYNGCRDHDLVIQPRVVVPARLVCVGRLIESKGFDDAIAAMPAVLDRHPDARLVIVGEGPHQRALEAHAGRLGIAAHVEFAGVASHDAVFKHLNLATLVIVPSRCDEGLGLAAIEASLMERPVIARRVGGLPEAVVNDVSGILVDHADDLAPAICRLVEHPELADTLGRAGRRHALARFDWQQHLDRYFGVYQQATEKREPL